MPTVVPETDQFPQTIRKPANGELADSGSFDSFIDEIGDRTRYLYNRSFGNFFDVKRAPFNALGDYAADDGAALVAAVVAAGAAGGGIVMVPPGLYLTSSTLNIPTGVSLVGTPGVTWLYIQHATRHLLNLTGAVNGARTVISGINLTHYGAAAGNLVNVDSGQSSPTLFENCTIGSFDPLHTGYPVSIAGAAQVDFNDCKIRPGGNTNGVLLNNTGARLSVSGGSFVCPPVYSSYLCYVSLGRATIRGADFDFTGHSSGVDPVGIVAGAGGASPVNVNGCNFFGDGGGGSEYALGADSGSLLSFSDNNFYLVNRFKTIGLLATGSSLDLAPATNASTAGSSYTVPTGVRSAAIKFAAGAVTPTITLPPVLFPGQQLDLIVYNLTISGLPISLAGYGFKSLQPTIGSNAAATAKFVAIDANSSGTPQWTQIGGWAEVSP